MCQLWALHVVIKRQLFTFIFAVFLLNLFYRCILLHKPIYGVAVLQKRTGNLWLGSLVVRALDLQLTVICSNPATEPRHLSHKPRKSVARFELGVGTRKKDRKKVTKGLYFTYLWRSPYWSYVRKNLFIGWCSRRNHVCQVSKRNFQGLQFYRRRILHFPIDFWMGLTTVQRYGAACDLGFRPYFWTMELLKLPTRLSHCDRSNPENF